MKKKDEYSDVCEDCIDKNFDEFMDAKMNLQEAMEWFNFHMKFLDMDITEGKDVTERLEAFKVVSEEIAKLANDWVFPAVDNHGCCEDCEGCADAPDCAADDGENGYSDDSEGNTIN